MVDCSKCYILTFTGQKFNPFDPNPETLVVEDIAHALSVAPRFGGHTYKPYSVAEHCLHLVDMVPPEYAMTALLHDAAEAYLTDMPQPIKACLPEYAEAEYRLMEFILQMFGAKPMTDKMHLQDTYLGNLEAWTYMGPYRNTPHFNIWLPSTFGFMERDNLKMLGKPMAPQVAEISYLIAFDMIEAREKQRNNEVAKATASIPSAFLNADWSEPT